VNLNATLARNVLAAGVLIQLATRVAAQPLLGFDFTRAETAREWGDPQ
jgi:hypothetical protein